MWCFGWWEISEEAFSIVYYSVETSLYARSSPSSGLPTLPKVVGIVACVAAYTTEVRVASEDEATLWFWAADA